MEKIIKKMWAKIILNSYFGFPPQPIITSLYNKNKMIKIQKEGSKYLGLIKQRLK